MSKQTDLINIPDAITVSGSNVGIGTSSPDAKLHLYNATNGNTLKVEADGNYNARIRIQAGSSNDSFLEFADPDDSDVGEIVYSHSSNSMRFNTNASERMRIDSTGNVGIGTSSPNNYSANHKSITLNAPTTPLIDLEVNGTRTGSFVGTSTNVDINAVANVPLRFLTNDTERMRIDSSGNLLVGHTSTHSPVSNGGSGVSLLENGQIFAGGEYPSYFNRENSDGDIIVLRKDGTTVGSIGVNSGDQVYFAASDGMGIKVDTDNTSVEASNASGADNDNAVNLGSSGTRWKDLYLSGGVYLGGTAAANKLDDVETGNWTPADGSGAGLTLTINSASYVKVGRLVMITFDITYPSTSTTNGSSISGLPFAVASDGAGSISTGYDTTSGVNDANKWWIGGGSSSFYSYGKTNANFSGGRMISSGAYFTA
jgi:hypothetical protein